MVFLFSEIDRAFKQFVFECMDWTETEKDGWIHMREQQQKDIPWDDPYPYFKVLRLLQSFVIVCMWWWWWTDELLKHLR